MIHAICDFCGKDCELTATLVSLTAFQNFARYHRHSDPYGVKEPTKSFVMCSDCLREHDLPNPYKDYSEITDQKLSYKEVLPSRKEFKPYQEIRPIPPVSIGDTLYLIRATMDYEKGIIKYHSVSKVKVIDISGEPLGGRTICVRTDDDESGPDAAVFEYPHKALGEFLFKTEEEAVARFYELAGDILKEVGKDE